MTNASEERVPAIDIVIGGADPAFGHGLGCGDRIAASCAEHLLALRG
jgi:hypothetical protein